jgi:hypothetical protein
MMKKIYMFVLIGIFLLISGEIAKSQPDNNCPFGFVLVSKYVQVNVGGVICQYKVYMCIKCNAGPIPQPIEVQFKGFVADPIDCGQNKTDVKNAICAIIFDPNWIEENLSDDCFSGFGPCPGTSITMIATTPTCWQKETGLDDKIYYISCEPYCGCTQAYNVCWDGSNFIKTPVGPPSPEVCVCPDPEPEVPDTGICFQLGPPCQF